MLFSLSFRYKAFLKSTVVGIPSGSAALQQPISFQQLSDQIEVVLRVVKVGIDPK